jgi:hypothetical protein
MQNSVKQKTILLTFDYELFLFQSGTVENCLIKPTDVLIEILAKEKIKVTFFVDILFYHLISMNSDFNEFTVKVRDQLHKLLRNGHRLELHLHPQWLNAKYSKGEWTFPAPIKYSIQEFDEAEQYRIFKTGHESLLKICREVIPEYKILAFRAGGLCIQPFSVYKKAFMDFDIKIDSSVAPGIKATSSFQNYNFSKSTKRSFYHFVDNPGLAEDLGRFVEIPISVYQRNLMDKFYEKITIKKYDPAFLKKFGDGKALLPKRNLKDTFFSKIFCSIMPDKQFASLDFSFPETLLKKLGNSKRPVFTIMTHPKTMSLRSFEFLENMIKDSNFRFMNFEEFYNKIIS